MSVARLYICVSTLSYSVPRLSISVARLSISLSIDVPRLALERVMRSLQGIQGTVPDRYLVLGRVTGSLQGI